MAAPWSHDGVPEDAKSTVLHTPACLDAEIQRRNMSFLEKELRVKVPDGEHIYYDERGKMSMTGVVSLVEESSKEPQFDTRILWGPGAEARVAKRLIDMAPAIKHSAWTTAQVVLPEIPANPNLSPVVITLLRSAIAEERECWKQLDVLETVHTLQSLLALNMEAIVASMCALTSIHGLGDDFKTAAQKVLPDVYFNFIALREEHKLLKKKTNVDGQKELAWFRKQWNPILEKLLPGRLANKMEKYADRMQYLLDNDKRYSPKNPAIVGYKYPSWAGSWNYVDE
ncbi:uncharacterized protein Triagg1_1391 [Trichoderma aggressivum f. europaeum]|uniref:Uncharacterized protein n=1 Tax=Trichoderma aggressivum f. europaeum TaxID=173218 RepID=A0AAE1IKB8_9HYPO|nr:hypothetical protein Triagg1_1391 [Trichoderma aggressivum f. europaeum]